MRNNLPVTASEKTFAKDVKLISTTDLKGRITNCNKAFLDISGFEKEELIGSPHNIVRHPDMPVEAFDVMWKHLKRGEPWMGMVKNRCKNGDFYWVDAYVTPVTEHGEVVGYESVRTLPSRKDVARAEKVYKRINAGKRVMPRFALSLPALILIIGAVLGVAGGIVAGLWQGMAVFLVASLLSNGLLFIGRNNSIKTIKQRLSTSFMHPLAAITYSDALLSTAKLDVGVKSLRSRLDAVLTRIEDESSKVFEQANIGYRLTDESTQKMTSQQHETQDVAAAMHQMTTTISEVSAHVQSTADGAKETSSSAQEGRKVIEETRHSIEALNQTVNEISDTVEELSGRSEKIAQVAQMIDQIAEQTNLLALNAAIEAARAGEHGRGFAVVADEVRQLAQRTQGSTKEIHDIIEVLRQSAKQSVEKANQGKVGAEKGVQQMLAAEASLVSIVSGVSEIADMADQMAAAVEEQAHVSEDINQQIVRISNLATESLDKANSSSESIQTLQAISSDLHELVTRFK
ncbi:Aerotaxis receptor [Marinomonas spartinae]|uniref:methyl-accepting chemotaxis protein n=1 Tax=Marinomonas spartinae TaxID=1792290 RepID=UPI000808F631|nr:PAS domain-containing methyl-accepting chemotaxis protein [Marinomonas spartinae]SBS26784.1 Aerotaxis receptor [Marinomonas spartinae]